LGHLDANPARVGLIDVDGLSWRGVFRVAAGDLSQAIADLTATLKMVRQGATLTLGQRTHGYLALAQYLAGEWDDALLTAEQGLSTAAIRARRFDLPLLYLAAACVPAGRGQAEEAERYARLAERVAASLDRLRADCGRVPYLHPALAWLDGWLAELQGNPEEAQRSYQRGEDTTDDSSCGTSSSSGVSRPRSDRFWPGRLRRPVVTGRR
jgi:tetratricopeptide (TPR) repeat protein